MGHGFFAFLFAMATFFFMAAAMLFNFVGMERVAKTLMASSLLSAVGFFVAAIFAAAGF